MIFIYPRALEISVKSSMWDPCPGSWVVVYIDVGKANNSGTFNVREPCHIGWMRQRHAMTLLLYPPIPYFQASDYSVTIGMVNNILLTWTNFILNHCRIFIQRCRSCICQVWRRCGSHFFPIFGSWCSQLRK